MPKGRFGAYLGLGGKSQNSNGHRSVNKTSEKWELYLAPTFASFFTKFGCWDSESCSLNATPIRLTSMSARQLITRPEIFSTTSRCRSSLR